MDSETLTKLGIAGAILFAGWKYGNGTVKAAALAIGANIIAKQIPYVKDVM